MQRKVWITLCWILVFVLILVLLGGLVAMKLKCDHVARQAAQQQAQITSLQTETEQLQDLLEQTETALRESRDQTQEALAQLDLAQKARDAALQKVREMEEAAAAVDVGELDAGTVLDAEALDMNDPGQYFCAYEIRKDDTVYDRIYGRSYVDNRNISLNELRYLKVLHYNFDHQIQVGELIVNAALEQDYLSIFRELFEAEYEIYSMHLIDNYWTGDGGTSDSASIDVNNTSAFCYRRATGSGSLSNHAFGRAIDINPQQNPYVSYSSGKARWSHSNANNYIDRTSGREHMITHDDICYQIFRKYGFSWGGDWNNPKDYQHFEKES